MERPSSHQKPGELSPEDILKIKQITTGIDVIPNEVKERASVDILESLSGNHPLNKIWRNEQGEIVGYLAFEDFKEHEAYAKYFATEGTLTENPFSFIPELINHAKGLGYTKIHFHGWNIRLNKVLEHFGFIKTHTDKYDSLSADHFEIRLDDKKDGQLEQKTKEAFKQKHLNHIITETKKTIETLDGNQKETLEHSYAELSRRLENQDGFELSDTRKAILKLKLARYLQRHSTVDLNTLFDAVVETPKFISQDKGGFDRLLELHEQKTMERIAEIRKRKAEQTGKEKFNPYEALFQTDSGEYYMARLLNMPHLEEESEYMNHCVGTSDSYINKMKRGDVEILSFRKAPHINPQTQRLEGDEPIITIEYNVRSKKIEQIKKHSDEYIKESDPFFQDFIESLKKLKETQHDTGEKRDFKEISNSELQNIKVKDYHLFTEQGEMHFRDVDPDSNLFILKMGMMKIDQGISKEDASKIFRTVEGIELQPEEFAYSKEEVNEKTVAYFGPFNPEIYQTIKQFPNIKYLYESYPDKKIFIQTIETDPAINSPEKAENALKEKGIYLSSWGKDILYKTEFSQTKEQYELVRFSVQQLGFTQNATTKEIYKKAQELGLELCPAEVGPQLRLKTDSKDYMLVAMEQIVGRDGNPYVFRLDHLGTELELRASNAKPDFRWDADSKFVFLSRKP